MTDAEDMQLRINALREQLRTTYGLRGASLDQIATRSQRVLPRWARKHIRQIDAAEPLLGHPKLERQVDFDRLRIAQEHVSDHLKKVDVADRRKGFWLGLAGSVALNLLAVSALFVGWLVWTERL